MQIETLVAIEKLRKIHSKAYEANEVLITLLNALKNNDSAQIHFPRSSWLQLKIQLEELPNATCNWNADTETPTVTILNSNTPPTPTE